MATLRRQESIAISYNQHDLDFFRVIERNAQIEKKCERLERVSEMLEALGADQLREEDKKVHRRLTFFGVVVAVGSLGGATAAFWSLMNDVRMLAEREAVRLVPWDEYIILASIFVPILVLVAFVVGMSYRRTAEAD